MRILYIHGYCSTGQSGTSDCLRKLLPDCEIISPDVPVDPLEAMAFLKQLCIDECPHIIIGTSLGGFYAHQLRNYATCICVNPALRLSTLTDILKVGTFEFFHKRKDGVQSFAITEETIEHFRYLEQHQFDNVEESEYTRKRVYGLFGTEDNIVNSKEEFARYYPNVTMFEGEHRMNNKVVKDVIVPLIKSIYEQNCKGEPCLGFFFTAEQANYWYHWRTWHDTVYTDDGSIEVECNVHEPSVINRYIEVRSLLESDQCPSCMSKEYDKLRREKNKLKRMHLDLRSNVFRGDDGKVGLKDVLGNIFVPARFDGIPERFPYFDVPYLIPVIVDGRYYLYDRKKDLVLSKGYERIFRYVGAYVDYYVAVEGSKKGILHSITGEEITPIEMDEVYEMNDPDAFIPLMKDGKAGACWGEYVEPIYEKMEIRSEEYTKVWLNGKQGWIDNDGKFTTKESEAAYGSWYDYSK